MKFVMLSLLVTTNVFALDYYNPSRLTCVGEVQEPGRIFFSEYKVLIKSFISSNQNELHLNYGFFDKNEEISMERDLKTYQLLDQLLLDGNRVFNNDFNLKLIAKKNNVNQLKGTWKTSSGYKRYTYNVECVSEMY